MIMLVLFSFVYALYIFIDLIPLYREKHKNIYWPYILLMASAYFLCILLSFNIKVPSPAVPIKHIVSAIIGI